MEPLSALSVAAAVVDFVEFGGKLVTTYFEVRSSVKGQPHQIVSLEASSADLCAVATVCQGKVESLRSSYPRHSESLARLTAECANAEAKLKSALENLTANPKSRLTHSGSKALVAIRSVWSEKELEEWGNS